MEIPSLVLFVMATGLITVVAKICGPQNQTAELRFTKTLGQKDLVRIHHQVPIPCCAEGYDNITWSRKEGNEWISFPNTSTGDESSPELQENKQVLRIYDAKLEDQTTYRCIASKGTQHIQHSTFLRVHKCDKLPRGPDMTDPSPKNQTIDELGVNVTFQCTGYFGCKDRKHANGMFVWWTLPNGSLVQTVNERYSVQVFYDEQEFKNQSTFTIAPVTEDDLKLTFTCSLYSTQTLNISAYKVVNIKRREKPTLQKTSLPWLDIGLSVAGGIVVIVLTLVLIAFFRYKYGPQIRLFLSSRIASLGPRHITNEKYIYNVFIYHADADNETAVRMKKKLNDENYEVFINADTEGNQNILRTFSEKTAQSALVLFLYSEALRNDNLANFLLQSFISERKGKDIMFLEVADYKPIEILDWARHAKDKEKLIEKSVEEHREIDDETVEIIRQQSIEVVDDIQFWKVLPRLKVPCRGCSEREKRYFWCSLQNRIPKFVGNKIKAVKQGSLEEEQVFIRQENKKKNKKEDAKREDSIPLTHSRNEENEIIINGAGVDNTVFTTEAAIDIPEIFSPNAIPDFGEAATNSTEDITVNGAANYVCDRMEEAHGHSVLSGQSSACRGEISSEEQMSFPDMPGDVFDKSDATQTKKISETSKQRNSNLNLIINMPRCEHGPSSCSPESGYVTSPVEKSSGIVGFLPKTDEAMGKDIGEQADS